MGLSNVWGNDYTGNGTTDNVALQAALSAINTAGSGEMFIRPGTFKIASGIGGATVGQYSNLSIQGSGRGQTVLQATAGVPMISLGSGDASGDNIWRNIKISDMTIDMNNQVGAAYGLALGICQDVLLENIHCKNQANGAKSMLFWGASSGASSLMLPRNLIVKDCIFSDSNAQWEMVTLAQGLNVKFINCTFRDKSSIYALLNYGTHDATFTNCHFENCGNGVNGFGMTKFVGCDFYNANVSVLSYNTTISACSFEADGTNTGLAGIKFLGYVQAAGESFRDALPANTSVSQKNNRILGCTFKRCNSSAIASGVFTNYSGGNQLSSDDLEIADCSFENTYWQGMDVKANDLKLRNITSYNSGQLGSSTVRFNFVFGAKKGLFEGLRSYDDQGTPTTTRDFFIDNQYAGNALPTQDLTSRDSDFPIGGVPYFYTVSGFTSTKPSNITIKGANNIGINPDVTYSQGGVTGSVTFDRKYGRTVAATLTGNLTPTFAVGIFDGEELNLELTQDATGSRTCAKPVNSKVPGGTMPISTAANARDVYRSRWDNSSWLLVG